VFVIGTPLVGLLTVGVLLVRYQRDMRTFQDAMEPPSPPVADAPAGETALAGTETPHPSSPQ
jgi:hypothetical protein